VVKIFAYFWRFGFRINLKPQYRMTKVVAMADTLALSWIRRSGLAISSFKLAGGGSRNIVIAAKQAASEAFRSSQGDI
jgi:hypothetical protein